MSSPRRRRGAPLPPSGRSEVLPSVLMDTTDGPSSVILEPTSSHNSIPSALLESEAIPSVLEKSPQPNRHSMTYTQLEKDIKGDTDEQDNEKYGTEVEIVNTLQEYFNRVDPRAPKHFINACLNLVESQGPKAVDGFLMAKYGVSPFESTQRENTVSISTDKNVMMTCRHIISEEMYKTRTMEELRPLFRRLYEMREDLHSQDDRIVVDAMCSWTFRYGVHFMSGKLEIFYLGSVESEDQTMVEVLKTLPEVPFHDELSRRNFQEKHKVEIKVPPKVEHKEVVLQPAEPAPIKVSSKAKKKEALVYVDDDISLDKDEVAFLWYHVYQFYEENNYAKGMPVEMIKQTENSVYYILQHGIEGFNRKVADKFGRRFMNLVFALPVQRDDDPNIMKQVSQYYSAANEIIKKEAVKQGKKLSKRSFSKLIEALNFKFANAQKKKNNAKKARQGNNLFKSVKNKARSTEKSFLKFAKKGKAKGKHQPEKLLEKKIKLFILQSMKTPLSKVDQEAYSLLKLHKKKGARAFKTRLKITYGGDFEQIDFMTEEEIDAMIDKIMTQSQTKSPEQKKRDAEKQKHNSAQFINIYKELSFYRNPETQMRYNKV